MNQSRNDGTAARRDSRTDPAEIQERAYYRYVDRGRIDGFDREDWRLAETELRGGEQPSVGEPDELSRVRRPTAPAAVRSQTSDAEAGSLSV